MDGQQALDHDATAAATIAAVAAAAAASHQAQEQQHLREQQKSEQQDHAHADPQTESLLQHKAAPQPADGVSKHRDDFSVQDSISVDDGQQTQREESSEGQHSGRRARQYFIDAHIAQHAVADAAAVIHQAHQHHPDVDSHSNAKAPDKDHEQQYQRAQQSMSDVPQAQSRSSKSRTAASPTAGSQPKRRKINTCLQCKARKVKCDKVRPLCGPCKKHGISSQCTWALEGDMGNAGGWNAADFTSSARPSSAQTAGSSTWQAANAIANQFAANAAQAAAAAAAAAARSTLNSTSASGANASANGPNGVEDNQAIVKHISQLKASLAQHQGPDGPQSADQQHQLGFHDGQFLHGSTASQLESLLNDRNNTGAEEAASAVAAWSNIAHPSVAERGMAANAVAMIAQHHHQPHAGQSSVPALSNGVSSFLFGSRFPFPIRSSAETIREVISLLPSNSGINFLLNDVLFSQYALGVSACASPKLVNIQLAKLHEHRDQGEFGSIDAAFLSLLFHLIVISADVALPADLVSYGVVRNTESLSSLIELWQATGEALLSATDFMAAPSLNALMALLASRYFCVSQGRLSQGSIMLALAIRIAQLLGLHRLGSAQEDEARWTALNQPENGGKAKGNHDFSRSALSHQEHATLSVFSGSLRLSLDSAWGLDLPSRSHLVREAARKTWFYLLVQDWLESSEQDYVYHIKAGQWNTALPLHLDDSELQCDVDAGLQAPTEKDRNSEPSDAAGILYIYEVAKVCAEISEGHACGKLPSYEAILDCDKKFHDIIAGLPVYLRLDGESEHLVSVREQEKYRPFLPSLRFFIQSTAHHRLVLLHRCYLLRGHRDKKYAQSVRSAINAARMVIFSRQSVSQRSSDGLTGTDAIKKYWFFRHQIFVAALVLCVHLLQLTVASATHGRAEVGEEDEKSRLRDEIAVASAMLVDADGQRTNAFPAGEDNDPSVKAKNIIAKLVVAVNLAQDKAVATNRGIGEGSGSAAADDNENLEDLYTNDMSTDDASAGTVTAAAAAASGGNAGSSSKTILSSAEPGLDVLLNGLIEDAKNVNKDIDSSDDDPDLIWKLIETYACPPSTKPGRTIHSAGF